MKKTKFLVMAAVIAMSIPLASCNKQLLDFNLKYDKVHVISEHKCYTITSWTDYEDGDQLQVTFKDGGTCLFHSNQIILVSGKCPICGE